MPEFCGTCKAPILWALTPAGKSSPIDASPAEGGNVLVLAPQALAGKLLSVVLTGDALELARATGKGLHLNHWASCPDRKEWREKQDAKKARAASAD